MFYKDNSVLVTGGASFIGSHLVDALVEEGADVTVVNDLSSGRMENLALSIDRIKFVDGDLRDQLVADQCTKGKS